MTIPARRTCFWFLFAPLLMLYIALAVPVFGYFVFDYLTDDALAGCARTSEGLISNCHVHGINAGWVSGAYIASTFLLGIANPLIAFAAIPVIVHPYVLFAWLALTYWLYPEQTKHGHGA